jgi:hypothetical protein
MGRVNGNADGVAPRLPPRPAGRRRRGQAMVEYLIVAGVLLTTVAVAALMLYALRKQSARVTELVASEYP